MKFTISLIITLCFLSAAAQKQATHKRIKISKSVWLEKQLPEGSGLVAWNTRLWTHNDSGAAKLYLLDTIGGKIIDTIDLPGIKNTDWEDTTQDSAYLYIGDVGNNAGERSRLAILRISKISLLTRTPHIDTIAFTWPETKINGISANVNLDCEAMVAVGDSIFLFTKEYKNGRRTRVFAVSKQPGNYIVHLKGTLDTKVLITGATFDDIQKRLVLCGYNLILQPFLLVFPEVNGTNFFGGKCQKVKVRLPFRQVEGIDSFDGKTYYLINEKFSFFFGLFHRKAGLHKLVLE